MNISIDANYSEKLEKAAINQHQCILTIGGFEISFDRGDIDELIDILKAAKETKHLAKYGMTEVRW